VAQSGNGIDLGAVYRLLTEVAETVRAHGERFDRLERRMDQALVVLNEHTRVLNAHSAQLDNHSRDIDDLKTSVSELRKDVAHYHEAVTSQGIHYSDLEDRVRRVERHLKLGPGE
jgi:chromosome segregation ATPase